jgi:hypothetical protein
LDTVDLDIDIGCISDYHSFIHLEFERWNWLSCLFSFFLSSTFLFSVAYSSGKVKVGVECHAVLCYAMYRKGNEGKKGKEKRTANFFSSYVRPPLFSPHSLILHGLLKQLSQLLLLGRDLLAQIRRQH